MDNEKITDKCPPPTLRQLQKEQKYQEMQEKEKFVKRWDLLGLEVQDWYFAVLSISV